MKKIDQAFDLILNKLEAWGTYLIAMLPNFFVAIIILIITFFVARFIRNGIDKLFGKFSHSPTINTLIATLIHVALLIVGFFIALSVLQLDKVVVSLLAGVGIIGLALGFAFQDIAANFISGIIIAVTKPFRVGDMIETQDYMGAIEHITLRTVDVRQPTGELVRIPNKIVFENPVTNYSFYHQRRVDLPVGVSYAEDLERVQQIVIDALQEVKGRVKAKDIEVMYDEFGDSSINFKVRFWITYKRQADYVLAKSDAIIRIKKAFDQNDILIPFPIRTLDFAIKGGENLTGQLETLQALAKNGKQTESDS